MSKIHHIQALRGIAASMVVLDHALGPLVKHNFLPAYFDDIRYNFGSIGVSIFFVISGFIMIRTSYNEFGSLQNSFLFMSKRIIRIVPIYWLATILVFLMSKHFENAKALRQLLESLFFIPYSESKNGPMQPLLGPGWTLDYEMFFYALFAIALLFPKRIGLHGLLLAFVGITAAGAFLKPLSDPSTPSTILTFWSNPIILLFATGIVIGLLAILFQSHIHTIYAFQISIILVIVQMIACVIFRFPNDIPFPGVVLFWAPGILAVAICVFDAKSTGANFERVAERVGDASYSTYIFHVFVLAALNRSLPISSGVLSVVYVFIALVGSNLIGILVNWLVERPVTSLLRNALGGSLGMLGSAGRLQRPIAATAGIDHDGPRSVT